MGSLILSIIILLIGVGLLISSIIEYSDLMETLGLGLIASAVLICIFALIAGRSIYKQDNTKLLIEKQTIEYVLENDTNYYIIKKAEEYNKIVNEGNNYFCRFNIEDRSEFEIDIYKYFNKNKEE